MENSAAATGLEKVSLIPIPKKGNVKECSKYHTIALISPASKAMIKILQARLQQYLNSEHQRSLEGYSLRGRKESDVTELLTLSLSAWMKTRNPSHQTSKG